jgi:hypothetical protein
LEAALQRGLADVEARRVRRVEQVKAMIPRWTSDLSESKSWL